MFRQAKSLRQTCHMRIDHDARRDSKGRAQHDVGRLATDARQLHKLFHIGGHFAAVFLDELDAAGMDVLGLVAKEARALNQLLQPPGRHVGQGGRRRMLGEQVLRHDVDALVRALGRKNRGDEQFKGRLMDQGAGRGRIFARQEGRNLAGVLLALHEGGRHRASGGVGESSSNSRRATWPPQVASLSLFMPRLDVEAKVNVKSRNH